MSKKGDARIARAVAQALKEQEKHARLVARVAADTPRERTIRLGADPGSIFHMTMAWHCENADTKDRWSWGQARQWGLDEWNEHVQPKLDQFSALQWREIDAFVTPSGHKAHHSMPCETIAAEPQARLRELEMEVDGDIFRFRVGAKKRLWGFRIVNVFGVLWYDPLHRIYPTDPD